MRKMNKQVIPLFLFLVLTISLIPFAISDGLKNAADIELNNDVRIVATAYVEHDSIIIDGDDDFMSQAAAEGWAGSGTEESPYIISGYHIVDESVQPFNIQNTECYWELRNNNVTSNLHDCGIWMDNNSHGVLAHNIFHHLHSGMYIVDAENVLIENNLFIDNPAHGIHIDGEVTNSIIRNNIFLNTGVNGISIDEGYNTLIYNNTWDVMTGFGIYFKSGSTNEIYNNSISNSDNHGIKLGDSCTECIVHENSILAADDGINCLGDDNTITSNIIRDSETNGIKMEYHSSTGEFASGNDVEDNSIVTSGEYSVVIEESCTGNSFTGNDFFDSSQVNHVEDNGTDNVFSENFYDTWIGPDVDVDGYVDNPFVISGSAENQDLLPLAEPINPIPVGYEYVPIEMQTGTTEPGEIPPMDIVPIMIIGAVGIVVIVGIFVVKKK